MCQLVNDLKWGDWQETYHCAITRAADGKTQSVLVVTGSLYERMQTDAKVQIDHWTIGDLCIELLLAIAHGFPIETMSNRYVLAMLEAIKKYQEDQQNIIWTTWDIRETP